MYQKPLQDQVNDVAHFAAWLGGALFLLFIGKTVGKMEKEF